MGDEEEAAPTYKYVGERAPGATSDVTAGEEPKVLTKAMELLGERQAEGEATFVNGDSFKGSFAGGSRHGSGKYVYAAPPPGEDEEPKPPVATYEGKWVDGEKSGVGVMTFASGVKYHGSFSAVAHNRARQYNHLQRTTPGIKTRSPPFRAFFHAPRDF